MSTLDLAEALTRGARAPLARAAVALLLQLAHFYDRADVVARWYTLHGPHGPHAGGFAVVDWHRVAADADRGDHVPMSMGERAVLLLAASFAVGHRVDLAELLPLLDSGHAAAAMTAVYSVLQARDPLTGEWDALRFAGQGER